MAYRTKSSRYSLSRRGRERQEIELHQMVIAAACKVVIVHVNLQPPHEMETVFCWYWQGKSPQGE